MQQRAFKIMEFLLTLDFVDFIFNTPTPTLYGLFYAVLFMACTRPSPTYFLSHSDISSTHNLLVYWNSGQIYCFSVNKVAQVLEDNF